ncbi:MAG: hypothetical protein JJ863_09810 [Deltaproteobacteria bacterium]|nr:hypothetical protein [Deltaproteobacteria bacterium]
MSVHTVGRWLSATLILGSCQQAPPAGRDDIARIDLGEAAIVDGVSGPVPFELPEGTRSFQIEIVGSDERLHYVASLSGPGGPLVQEDYDPEVGETDRMVLGRFGPQRLSPNPVVPTAGVAAALFPNGPVAAERVSGGTYTLRVGATDGVGRPVSETVAVHLWVRETPVDSGEIDLHLYLTGAGGLSTESDSTSLEEALDGVRAIFAARGVVLSDIELHDVETRFAVIDRIEGPGDLRELFSRARGDGLHVFLVARFSDGGAGVSGGIPGPAFSSGAPASAVAVALDVAGSSPELLARSIAHECAHWLGLFHTSQSGRVADPLSDTPIGELESENLLFPELTGGAELTPQQGEVLRSHPAIRRR